MLWKAIAPQTSISEVTVMMPSRAMFTTPARSENTAPRAAKAIGRGDLQALEEEEAHEGEVHQQGLLPCAAPGRPGP